MRPKGHWESGTGLLRRKWQSTHGSDESADGGTYFHPPVPVPVSHTHMTATGLESTKEALSFTHSVTHTHTHTRGAHPYR